MSYYLFDVNGYVGDLASIRGLRELREVLSEKGKEIDVFLDEGCSEKLLVLREELLSIDKPDNKDVASTLKNLLFLIKKCTDIAIISDGLEYSNDSNKEDYLNKEIERIKKLYSRTKHSDFQGKDNFVNWFKEQIQKQKYACYYCGTSICDIEKLIKQKKLKTRKAGKGGIRGPMLEVDRKINGNGYSKSNCVLACYYCNNDKSYIFDSDDYKKHFGKNRNKYFSNLLLNKSNNS